MLNLKRYDWEYDELDHQYNCVESPEGEWVKFDDIAEGVQKQFALPCNTQSKQALREIAARLIDYADTLHKLGTWGVECSIRREAQQLLAL